MIQIKGTSIDDLQCYSIQIRNKIFYFISKPDLSNLKHFTNVNHHSLQKQQPQQQPIQTNQFQNQYIQQRQDSNEREVMQLQDPIPKNVSNNHPKHSNTEDFSQLKVHFNLNYLKDIFNPTDLKYDQQTLNILITNYQDFITLPYIHRKLKNKHHLQFFATHIMYQMGRIYVKSIFDKIATFDLLNSQPTSLTYEEESQLQDSFYLKFGVQIKTWARLFTRQQMEQSLTKVTKMNYGEVYDADGVKFRAFPSGHSLGSSLWVLQNTLTKQNVMFIKQISSQTWRSISQNYIISSQKQKQKFRQNEIKNISMLVLANKSLITPEKQKSDAQIMKMMKTILEKIQKNVNVDVVLEDQLLILDIIEHISFEMKDKFKSIFIQNRQFNQIVSYANSYVQFLSNQYKERIYRDPPEYPFEGYLVLRHKGLLSTGSYFDICERNKIPLKQLIRRSSPYINFKSDYSAYLQGVESPSVIWHRQKNYLSPTDLNNLLKVLNPKKVVSYADILSYVDPSLNENVGILQFGKKYSVNSEPYHYYISKNISPNIINKYQFVDGYIMAYPVNRQFLRLSSSWTQQLYEDLKKHYRAVLEVNKNGLRTKSTQIWVQNFEIFIKSSDPKQTILICQIISRITKTLRLK